MPLPDECLTSGHRGHDRHVLSGLDVVRHQRRFESVDDFGERTEFGNSNEMFRHFLWKKEILVK